MSEEKTKQAPLPGLKTYLVVGLYSLFLAAAWAQWPVAVTAETFTVATGMAAALGLAALRSGVKGVPGQVLEALLPLIEGAARGAVANAEADRAKQLADAEEARESDGEQS